MTLSVLPMLPEDRKYLDVPLMPVPGMCFRKGGRIWQLVGVRTEACPTRNQQLTLEFVAIDPVNPVNPV